ncbi:MAG: UDP-N-acetylmuramoyl-tripeptide--D-alanyl-D-alanine ligase [Treponema sp.]|nr:UDP-N-acetylmuramoyl-tripeptide--D-alanyl-D-alanine ligase [Treponema sp.]
MVSDGSDNVLLLTFAELSHSLGGEVISFGSAGTVDAGTAGFSSVSVDSRAVREGALFAALPGSERDGHSFVEEAFKNGAAAALVERRKLETGGLLRAAKNGGKTLIAVNDTLQGLQDAAGAYLEKFPRLVKVGVTGSSGKTTTKEIAAAIIGAEKKVVMNPGNYNSETGLPLAVFAVRPWHEVGIFEMGMNRKGEIKALASVLKPDIALITNVGSAHIGILGSKEAIAEEKKEIFSRFTGNCTALIPVDSDYRDFLAEGLPGRVVFFGGKLFADLGGVRDLGLDGSEITWAGERIRFALPGRHNLADAFAAIAIALEIPVSGNAVRQGLESVKPLFGRGEIIRGPVTVLRDCYNANPESLAEAVEFCESLDWPGRRVYVIGEMLELGENSRPAHEGIGRLLSSSKADKVFLFGKETEAAADQISGEARFFHTCDIDELSKALEAYLHSGDFVLIKGSRGCALERLSGVLEGRAA